MTQVPVIVGTIVFENATLKLLVQMYRNLARYSVLPIGSRVHGGYNFVSNTCLGTGTILPITNCNLPGR